MRRGRLPGHRNLLRPRLLAAGLQSNRICRGLIPFRCYDIRHGGKQTTLTTTLRDISTTPAIPVVGVTVRLSIGSQFCNAITNASGVGSCNLTPSATGNFSLTASFLGNAQYTPATLSTSFSVTARLALDVDGDGAYDALTDGLLIMRWLATSGGSNGAFSVAGTVATNATRITESDITAYLTALNPMLDVDGNSQFDAQTDGLLIVRYLLGFRGVALISGAIGSNPTRFSAPDIEAYLRALAP